VVKVFKEGSQGNAVQLELQNLERARQHFPDNVVKTKPLLDPRNPKGQNFVVKEEVTPRPIPPADQGGDVTLANAMGQKGVRDPGSNLIYGVTPSAPNTPRWYLIE
jgi:hypothetical protein